MQRLPLHQQLSSSQQMLVKLSPSWRNWLHDNLNKELSNSAVLSHYADGRLLISCDNAAIASQLKHLQTSLMGFLNETGFKEIHTISIRIEHLNQDSAKRRTNQNADKINQEASYCQPSSNSLKSIKHCHQSVKSETLSAALQRLEKTLKGN